MATFGAPAAGGFGAKAPAAGFGAPAAAPAVGGFGAPAAAAAPAGGFGAPAAAGFGAKAPAAAGFGAPAAAPAAGGFGAPAAAAPAAGFGAPAAGGFGAPAAGGFGAKAPAAVGFGAPAPAAGGFGAPPAGAVAAPAQNPYAATGGFDGVGSVVAKYLLRWDSVYNADDAQCHFRTFFYNACTPGHSEAAVQREREIAEARSGPGKGCSEEQWLIAKRDNPDPDRLTPSPVHFNSGLQTRHTKQLEQLKQFHAYLLRQSRLMEELLSAQQANQEKAAELRGKQAMLERKLLQAIARSEALRQHGLRLGQAHQTVQQPCTEILRKINAHDGIMTRLKELAPDAPDAQSRANAQARAEAIRQATQESAVSRSVSVGTLRDWTKAVGALTDGATAVRRQVTVDLAATEAALKRLQRSRG